MATQVTIVNDYPVVVAGLAALLRPFHDRVEVVGADPESSASQVDVVLYDSFGAPLGRAADLSRPSILQHHPVAVYSFTTDSQAIRETMDAGAAAYLAKSLSAEQLVEGIEQVADGSCVVLLGEDNGRTQGAWPGQDAGLSVREAEMLALIAAGRSNSDICTACYLSLNTVKSYIRSAYRKIGVSTRAQAVAWSLRHGLGQEPGHHAASTSAQHL